MKIAIVTTRIPYPPHRGDKIKLFNLIRRLSQRHEISLVCMATEKEKKYIESLTPLCKNIKVFVKGKASSIVNAISAGAKGMPLQVGYFENRELREYLNEICKPGLIDILHIHLIRAVPWVRNINVIPRLLDQTDAMSLYWERRFKKAAINDPRRLLYYAEWKLITKYERRVIPEFDRCLTCSPSDLAVLSNLAPEARYDLLPNGLDLERLPFAMSEAFDQRVIVYMGYMGYAPNIDSVLYFHNYVYPIIKTEIPDAKFLVVGKDPPKKVKELAEKDDSVTVTGFVDDLWPYVAQAAVSVNPMRFGAGTQNKVLEAMAIGTPVVTTSMGADGLGAVAGRDFLVADSPKDFAHQVIQVMREPSLRKKLRHNARRYVQENHDWDAIVRHLEGIYAQVIEEFQFKQRMRK